jgi:hypothetical protein
MSRALANLGLAVFLILAAAFLTRPLGLELRVLNATMVSEIAAARFAVGTRVTSRPPHRSVHAAFPHTAPTSGV